MESAIRAHLRVSLAAAVVSLSLTGCGGGGGASAAGPATFTLGGTVSGLGGGQSLVLLNNGGDALSVNADGTFTFPTTLVNGQAYAVTVGTGPAGQSCAVTNGAGTVASASVTDVVVGCSVVNAGLPWAWVGGANLVYASGIYGSLGTPSTGNAPGARDSTLAWTDASGRAWLFGGIGVDAAGTWGFLGDLWVLDGSAGWRWAGGSDTVQAAGRYGNPGISAPGNVPGARAGAAGWTDAAGHLWLFGGRGYDSTGAIGSLNDLWMFDPATGQWTWVGGSNVIGAAGVYGTLGVGTSGNVPGARDLAVTWSDSNGRLWLFGGFGVDAIGQAGNLDDLWMFNPVSGVWTWVSGSSAVDGPGVYGVQGQAQASNMPGARNASSGWVDSSGRLWLFGGAGYDAAGAAGTLNDLWRFDPASGQWTWVSGSNAVNAPGVYGTPAMAAAADVPGARYGASAWADAQGRLWLFGGSGLDAQGANGLLNDLWVCDSATLAWTWMGGSSVIDRVGVYPAAGSATMGVPGARYGAAAWFDKAGRLWLFGGHGVDATGNRGDLSDAWAFRP